MEQEHGSLIAALQFRAKQNAGKPRQSIFTSLREGTGALAEALIEKIPGQQIRKQLHVIAIARKAEGWEVTSEQTPNLERETTHYDEVILALPVHRAAQLLAPTNPEAATLMQMPSSSATIVAFGFDADQNVAWPKGFGFLAPEGEGSQLLAATFCDNKFANRVPPGGKLIRAYFGGANADRLSGPTAIPTAKAELEQILGPLPTPRLTVQRYWPQALPQYGVGHLDRMAQLQQHVDKLGHLHLLGNGYRGVGLPDLIRDARAAARTITKQN
jgi:protoporphyrinogen/coproporphyrinogen III oxidase